jgi:hypothetical protein
LIHPSQLKWTNKKINGLGGSYIIAPTFSHPNLPTNWNRGDIIWANGQSAPGLLENVGMVGSSVEDRQTDLLPKIIDSNTDGGVRDRFMSDWVTHYSVVARLAPSLPYGTWCATTFNKCVTYGEMITENAWAFVNSQIGKPYNIYLPNSNQTNSFYCSQLIWAAYLQNAPGNYNYNITSDKLFNNQFLIKNQLIA